MTATPAQRISLVSACRNEARHIRAFLDSLLSQEFDGFDWEIIIADGMSDDGTRAILEQYAQTNPLIRVIDNPGRIVSSGLNAAIRSAQGDIILRIDAHTEYATDYVRKCVETLETSGAQNVGGPARTKADGTRARAIQAAYHSRFSTGGAAFHDETYSGYADTVPYGCWRKETLVNLGLFDEELVRNQDDELNLRLIRSGGKIWQSANIVSWYRPRATFSGLFRQYFQYGFWKVRVIRKHRIPGSWRHLVPGLFVLAAALPIVISAVAAAIGAEAVARDIFLPWCAVMAVYALACVTASCIAARNNGWELLPYLPVAFAAFHFSYGLGFLLGSAYFAFAKSKDAALGDLFVGVTR